jgi:hypothetical protein
MKYQKFIEENFVIDEPTKGQLVPFRFNKVQQAYYNDLKKMGIEEKGVELALREFIVKARREGFSSLILALFAADDILQENPTESNVVSYKDDATDTFRKRYRRFVLSWYAKEQGMSIEEIQANPNNLERYKRFAFSVDANDLELRHNRAHFYCGTASARTGGRGGVLQKLLFSEAAHYPDTEKMTAKEIIEGTAQQVDKSSGWIFQESTGNGKGNYFYATYELIKRALSRYVLRFYGWKSFYTAAQFKVIASEFTDPDMLKQEYPETEEEAFLSSNLAFTSRKELLNLVKANATKKLVLHLEIGGTNYIDQCETILAFILTHERTHPNRNMYVGIDSAKSVDRTVVTILQEKDLKPGGGVQGLCIDSTGQGDFMPDWFARNTKWYIHRVKFSRPSKSIMYKNLQVILQGALTELPEFLIDKDFLSDEWKHFYKQMLDLQKELIGDLLVVGHPHGECGGDNHDYDNCPYHDDYPDSWALAELLYVVINGVPKGQRPPEDTGNFDNSVRRLLAKNKTYGAHRPVGDDTL